MLTPLQQYYQWRNNVLTTMLKGVSTLLLKKVELEQYYSEHLPNTAVSTVSIYDFNAIRRMLF